MNGVLAEWSNAFALKAKVDESQPWVRISDTLILPYIRNYGDLAQMVERYICTIEVKGSTPLISTGECVGIGRRAWFRPAYLYGVRVQVSPFLYIWRKISKDKN